MTAVGADELGMAGVTARRAGPLTVAALGSAGAAVLHATAAGAHSDPVALARIFIITALLQGAAAMAGVFSSGRLAALALVGVNAAAIGGWLTTRLTGLSDIPGLEVAESPGLADSAAAALAAIAVLGSLAVLFDRAPGAQRHGAASAAVVVAALVTPAMFDVTNHEHGGHSHETAAAAEADHSHDTATAAGDDHPHPDAPGVAPLAVDGHDDGHDAEHDGEHVADDHDHPAAPDADAAAEHDDATDDHAHDSVPAAETAVEVEVPAWPRPFDPTAPLDLSGVPGVTAEQQARAEQLVADTIRDLPAFADVTSVGALGYRSIGDASTGFEHYINLGLLGDDKVLDPTAPESLVYQVDDPADPLARTLVSAMFIARATGVDDPELTGYAGPLMQWHNHTNLCWGRNAEGSFVVMGVTSDAGTCPDGQVNTGGEFPMVHVWIAPHECGPFAALEGHGAGQSGNLSDAERVDLCGDHHSHDGAAAADDHGHAAAAPVPYDPELPIDLGGVDGVTPQQQAFAENLVADTVRNLPQWSDPAVAEAAGFHSIGDGGTGHEHFIQWDWIDDDVFLDPDHPESLVYEPQPDGSRKLVSAMYMLPAGTPLADVPDWGGALMQWHVHGDLCFTADPVAPQVAGVKPIGEPCRPPLVELATSPMIHVWITPTPCGPFAALDGIGAGQVAEGEEKLCDSAHGSH